MSVPGQVEPTCWGWSRYGENEDSKFFLVIQLAMLQRVKAFVVPGGDGPAEFCDILAPGLHLNHVEKKITIVRQKKWSKIGSHAREK